VIQGTCEDFHAGVGCDCAFDDADRKGRKKITASLLALWGAGGRPFRGDRQLDICKNRALDVRGEPLECGHFIAEAAPDALLEKLSAFL
jgi:haloacetate dehalogenase